VVHHARHQRAVLAVDGLEGELLVPHGVEVGLLDLALLHGWLAAALYVVVEAGGRLHVELDVGVGGAVEVHGFEVLGVVQRHLQPAQAAPLHRAHDAGALVQRLRALRLGQVRLHALVLRGDLVHALLDLLDVRERGCVALRVRPHVLLHRDLPVVVGV
jgi:hypothetical protein